MDYPRIDTSGISDKRKATDKFKSAYEDMRRQLMAPGFIAILCAHEAAHVFYFIVAGARHFKPYPATLSYDETLGDYAGSLASVQQLDLPQWKEGQFADWFSKVACAHAAGGVVARKLKPFGDVGDLDDEERFHKLCARPQRRRRFDRSGTGLEAGPMPGHPRSGECRATVAHRANWIGVSL